MTAPDEIVAAVAELSKQCGREFRTSSVPVTGTNLYVVYALEHPFPSYYAPAAGTLGFRVPSNFPDACPEDSFFIIPHNVKLTSPDPVRRSIDIHRAGEVNEGYFQDTGISSKALVFSWHLWNKAKWIRNKHTLIDHYAHCLRRFEQPEHD